MDGYVNHAEELKEQPWILMHPFMLPSPSGRGLLSSSNTSNSYLAIMKVFKSEVAKRPPAELSAKISVFVSRLPTHVSAISHPSTVWDMNSARQSRHWNSQHRGLRVRWEALAAHRVKASTSMTTVGRVRAARAVVTDRLRLCVSLKSFSTRQKSGEFMACLAQNQLTST
eukprot:4285131-Amphidinium_carterae.1